MEAIPPKVLLMREMEMKEKMGCAKPERREELRASLTVVLPLAATPLKDPKGGGRPGGGEGKEDEDGSVKRYRRGWGAWRGRFEGEKRDSERGDS